MNLNAYIPLAFLVSNRFFSCGKVPWSSIGGMESVKEQLQEAIEMPEIHREFFERLKIPAARGILLYGPPGKHSASPIFIIFVWHYTHTKLVSRMLKNTDGTSTGNRGKNELFSSQRPRAAKQMAWGE